MLLRLINRVFRGIQRFSQGIPSPAASIYEKVGEKVIRHLHQDLAESISARITRGDVVLDVGCGTGSLLSMIDVEGVRRIGLDISPAMLRIALKRVDCHLLVGDAHLLPLRDGCVDLLMSTGTLHHLRRPPDFFSECLRVTRGEAWIAELSYDSPREEFVRTSDIVGVPSMLLKVASAMHGVPRSEFEGWIHEVLSSMGARHKILSRGIATLLVISSPQVRRWSR